MADTKEQNDPNDTNRIAPRSVDPEHRDKVGGDAEQSTSDDRGRSVRRDDEIGFASSRNVEGRVLVRSIEKDDCPSATITLRHAHLSGRRSGRGTRRRKPSATAGAEGR